MIICVMDRFMKPSVLVNREGILFISNVECEFSNFVVLILAQVFGAMPVIGVKGKDTSQLRYTYKCFRTIYSFVMVVALTLYVSITIYWSLSDSIEFDKIGKICICLVSTYFQIPNTRS